MIEHLAITTDDGTCPARVLRPDGDGRWPGVLLYMDGIGMRPAVAALAEHLASAGYVVLLPDVFYRAGAYTAPDPKQLFASEDARKAHFARFSSPTFMADAMRDTRAYLAHLAGRTDVRDGKQLGVVGYCMGGRLALSAAGTFPEHVAAAAAYHPGGVATDAPDSPHLLAPKIRARVYVGGAMEDQSFPDEQKQRLEQALTAANVDHVIETYPARHGWVPSDTPVHDAAQAERHWQTLLALFRATIG